jgi:hypothetical protein
MDKDKFLNEIVLGWMKRDLERMIKEIPVRPGEAGNINFFLALDVLVSTEFLGGFLLGGDRGFEKNVEEYINKCFSEPGEYKIEILKDIYRNGLAHEFFPRGAVSRSGGRPAILIDDKIGIVLDAETLANDFLSSLEKFRLELNEGKYNLRMQGLKKSAKYFLDTHKEIINKLPQKITTSTTTSISTSSSSVSEADNLDLVISTPPQDDGEEEK